MRAFASQKGPGKGLPASGFAPERRESPEFPRAPRSSRSSPRPRPWDAYGGGVVAVVGGLAIVATQVSPGFCGKSGYPDCLLGVGLFAVVAFLLITTVKALWNGWLGLWGF